MMRDRAGLVGLLALALAGCGGGGGSTDPAPAKPFEGIKLVVGVVGDPALAPLDPRPARRVVGQDRGRAGDPRRPVDPADVRDVDVVVFPGDRMGDLVAARGIAPLLDSTVTPPEAPEPEGTEATAEAPPDPLQYQEVVLAYRDQVTKYGPDRMGLPLGGSALVVAYRRAAFDDPGTREAARAAGVALEPPATWEQFDALARFFHGRDRVGGGRPVAGVALAFGADPQGVGDAIFLARAAALGWHRDQFSYLFDSETTDPRVASPPFVEALEGLVGLKASAPAGAARFDAQAAREAFRRRRRRAFDRPGRARRHLGFRRLGRRRRPPARLAPGLRPVPQGLGRRLAAQPAELPPVGRRLAGRSGRIVASGRRRPRTSPGTWPGPTRPTGSGPSGGSRCLASGRPSSPRA